MKATNFEALHFVLFTISLLPPLPHVQQFNVYFLFTKSHNMTISLKFWR